MLRKETNPGLFEQVRRTYNNIVFDLPNSVQISSDAQEISQDQLDMIRVITLVCQKDAFIESLEGIEKLKNLENININGVWQEDYYKRSHRLVDVIKNNFPPEEHEARFRDLEREMVQTYLSNQLTDLSPLAKCPQLKGICLQGQRKIESIDVSQFPNLKIFIMNECPKLERVEGLDKLDIKEKDKIDIRFYGCDRLNDVSNYAQFVEKVEKSAPNSRVIMPITTYMHLTNRDQSLRENEKFQQSKKFCWVDEHTSIRTFHVEMVKTRVDEIMSLLCRSSDSPLTRIACAYNWISENIDYDTKASDAEKKAREEGLIARDEYGEPLQDTLRSSYVSLFKKKGVCVAKSSLFSVACAEQGVLVERVLCGKKDKNFISEKLTFWPIHSIAKINLKADGEDNYYFFDPTFDMHNRKGKNKTSRFFCLNADEERKLSGYSFGIDNTLQKVAPSLQEELKKTNLLYTIQKPFSFDNISNRVRLTRRKRALIKKYKRLGMASPLWTWKKKDEEIQVK